MAKHQRLKPRVFLLWMYGRAPLVAFLVLGLACGESGRTGAPRDTDGGAVRPVAFDATSGSGSDAGDLPDSVSYDGDGSSTDAATTDAAALDLGFHDAGPADQGPAELPSHVTSDVQGDVVATLANSPYLLDNVDIHGSLRIEAGVVFHWRSADHIIFIFGDLEVGEGSAIQCVFTSPGYTQLNVLGRTRVLGTPSEPITFGRENGGFNNACILSLGSADIHYARFSSNLLRVGASTTIRDSIFDLHSEANDRSWIVTATGAPADDVVIEYNRFVRTSIRGHGYSARHNDFQGSSGGTSIEVSSGFLSSSACAGDRDTDPAIVLRDNVFAADAGDEIFSVHRAFGPVDFSGNYFASGLHPEEWDDWNGGSEGCPDGLGAYGGPITGAPALNVPPTVGPR
jgi:hypothetical protein